MRTTVSVAALATILCFAALNGFAKTPPAAKSGSIVIVFKDGHRQSINMADVDRIEFPGSNAASATSNDSGNNALVPSRSRFVGKWEAGDGNGGPSTSFWMRPAMLIVRSAMSTAGGSTPTARLTLPGMTARSTLSAKSAADIRNSLTMPENHSPIFLPMWRVHA